jgi:3-oxoacyl-(acyl-carrier-protein) synthase
MRRVVVTGIGIVSPLGVDLRDASARLRANDHGIRRCQWDAAQPLRAPGGGAGDGAGASDPSPGRAHDGSCRTALDDRHRIAIADAGIVAGKSPIAPSASRTKHEWLLKVASWTQAGRAEWLSG